MASRASVLVVKVNLWRWPAGWMCLAFFVSADRDLCDAGLVFRVFSIGLDKADTGKGGKCFPGRGNGIAACELL